MIRQSLIILMLAVVNSMASTGQPCYEIKLEYPIQPLDSFLSILADSSRSLHIDDVLSDSTLRFIPFEHRSKPLDSEHVYWAELCLISTIDTHYVLYFNDPLKGLAGWIQSNGHIDLYELEDDNVKVHKKSGSMYAADQKDIAEDWNINRFHIPLKAHQATHYIIRIEGNQFGRPPFFNLELRNQYYNKDEYPLHYFRFTSIILGMLLISLLYYTTLFYYSRDPAHGWYVVWLFVSFLATSMVHPQGLFTEYVLFNVPWTTYYFWALFSNAVWIVFWLFGRAFIQSKINYPKLDRSILILIAVITLLIIMSQALDLIASIDRGNSFNGVYFGLISMTRVVGIVIAVILIFKPERLAKYFGVGAILANLGPIIGVLHFRGLLSFPVDPYMGSVGLQVCIYSIGLAYRQRLKDKAFKQAQLQLVNNEKIKAEAQRIKDLDEVKSRFFANISHEFRTPLSLILGPLNQSLEAMPASESIFDENEIPVKGRHLYVMKKNAQRLLQLVDQILDLSKVDSGQMKIRLEKGDLIQFTRAIVFSFESLAERRHIHFQTHFGKLTGDVYFDRDKIEKIIVNLLSNAFKFTPEHGEVMVSIEGSGSLLKMSVTDTGSGMSKEDSSKIFDRFYQTEGTLDQGTGIGLALVKELVGALQGQISVESHENKGTKFTVSIPYKLDDFNDSAIVVQHNHASDQTHTESYANDMDLIATLPPSSSNSEAPLLLIIEDNPDLALYIGEQFNEDYHVVHAKDGLSGWSTAQDKLPDLIISDVMMPGMNGIELCNKLKSDIKTSHIPVIMLTAKADHEAKIKGLETGADDYLTKPFDGRELKVRVKNLIEQRQALRELYSDHIISKSSNQVLSSMDERFIKQVIATIEDNMGNEFFTVEDLAGEVGFSRSQLNRKIKGLTDKTTNQLIREWRLTRAHELLKHQTATVSEVAYQVGYSNLSYFAKSYKELFGYLPSETAN